MRLRVYRPIVLMAATAMLAAAPAFGRDWRTWPFSRLSPWNHPIGSGARYADVPGLAGRGISLLYDDRWTSAVALARPEHPLAAVLFSPATGPQGTWEFIASGGRTCGNSPAAEAPLVAAASSTLAYPANYYSTLATPDTSRWLLPSSYHRASEDVRALRLPPGTCPSPDTDGYLAVFMPDGWVFDAYAAVVLSDGRVLTPMASWIDARGDGTGWWNGRRASMLPSFAGLIRHGELAAGRIPHALAAQISPELLREEAVWPAATFDRNAGYSGTLPMGTLLAIPPDVDVEALGLTPRGKVLARAAQDYGIYVVDRGGSGLNILAELGNREVRWENDWRDLWTIRDRLKRVTNNTPATPGGGGTPRTALAPPFTPEPVSVQAMLP